MKIEGWSEYWNYYDSLCKSINDEELIKELNEAKKYVNGMTDGWYDFLNAFESAISNSSGLNSKQQALSEQLITELKGRLKNR